MNAKTHISVKPTAHPALLKTAGNVKAPVPTMRLNTYTSPVCNNQEKYNIEATSNALTLLSCVVGPTQHQKGIMYIPTLNIDPRREHFLAYFNDMLK